MVDKRLKVYEAQFKPTVDDGEMMLQIKEDFKGLFLKYRLELLILFLNTILMELLLIL